MSIPLRGYKLILLTTGTANAKEISIELVASLWFCRTNDNGLFTIGGQSVKNADIKIPNTEVLKFTRGFNSDETVSTTNFLTNGNQYPNALAVLKGETANKVLPFSLSSKHTFLHVDNKAKADIKKDIIDMVVYGRRAPFSRCQFFEDLWPDFAEKKYMLRDFDEQRSTQDLTLNRCTIKTSGFLPEYFKLGRATPGQENDCSGVHFILEDHILDAATLLSQYPDPGDEQDLHTEAQCSREQDSSSYAAIGANQLSGVLRQLLTTSANDRCSAVSINPYTVSTQIHLDRANAIKRKFVDDADYSLEYEWETTKHFKSVLCFFTECNINNKPMLFTSFIQIRVV